MLKQKPVVNGELVPVTALPQWAHELFNAPKLNLNHVQSKAFPIVFGTDEPILLCAPTRSGKVCIYHLHIWISIKSHVSVYRQM